MFGTGPVTAAELACDSVAGKLPVLTKIVPNPVLGLAAVAYSVPFARRTTRDGTDGNVETLWLVSEFPARLSPSPPSPTLGW